MPAEALIRSSSWDPETRTVEAVIATTSPVTRRDAQGVYLELLDPETLDLERSRDIPVLDSHNTATARAVLGRAETMRVEDGAVVATLRLTSAEDAVPILQRIADGSLTGVSIGYAVPAWTTTTTREGRTKRPRSWRITEVTLTSQPAGPSARLRQTEESTMPEATTAPSAEEVERNRRSEIRGLVRDAGLQPELADELIDAGTDSTAAKARVFDESRTRSAATPTIRVHTSSEDPAVIQERQAEALHVRMSGGEPKPEARPYMGASLLDLARDSLTRAGVSTRGLSADETFTRAAEHTTSDFPLVVSNAMNKTAIASYQAAQSPLKRLGRQRSLSNFKTATAIRLGELGRLQELDESGEFKHTTRGENGESFSLATYGSALNVSRKLLFDDDLGLLGDITAGF